MGVAASTASTIGTIGTGLSILSGVSSIFGGFQQRQESNNQADLIMQSSAMQAAETKRLAAKEALVEQENADEARRRQQIAYLASGVTLQGSPLLVMEETRKKGLENVDEILKAGSASASTSMTEGRIRAQGVKAQGRQAFMSGITQGVQTAGSAISAYAVNKK